MPSRPLESSRKRSPRECIIRYLRQALPLVHNYGRRYFVKALGLGLRRRVRGTGILGCSILGSHMKVSKLHLTAFALLAGMLLPRTGEGLDAEKIVQQNERAVVVILGTKAGSDAPVQSSGCYVHSRGFILTTAHQVLDVQSLRAKNLDGTERSLSVVAIDKKREIALLKSEGRPPQISRIGDARTLRSGSPLVSIATPENLDFSTVDGIVSNTNRTYRGYPVIQAKLPANPGSSGGPVFDKTGALVGVIIGKLRDQEWVTVINPVNNAYDLLREHGVAVPRSRAVAPDDTETEIIPVKDATPLELEAIRAYNRGVAATASDEKVDAYGMAVKLLPVLYEGWFNLAVAHTAANEPDQAIAAYRKAEELKPQAVEVQRNLGRIFLKRKELDKALACFERAIQYGPDDAGAHNDLGEVYRQLEQYDKAEKSLSRALELNPNYPAARFNLALTYAAAGMPNEAIQSFQDYLRLAPDAPDIEKVRQWIQRLEKENK